jgi:hypothetical protein
MSRLVVNNLEASKYAGGVISVAEDSIIKSPGMVAQVKFTRTDRRIQYSAPANNSAGITVADLNLTITPKFSDSLLIMEWMINGETHHDTIFNVHRNGELITDPGYEAYNREAGRQTWSGLVTAIYDNNTDSTPSNLFLQYAIPAYTTLPRTYAPAVSSSSTASYTLSLNRTNANAVGTNAYEIMVSTGMIMEVIR